MKLKITVLLCALMLMPMQVQAGKPTSNGSLPHLTQVQDLRLTSFLNAVYRLNDLAGPLEPAVCFTSSEWDDYAVPGEQGMRELMAPLNKNQMREFNRLFDLATWWVTLDQLGCGNFTDPTRIYDFVGD
jgi:hypothetical protein